MLLPPEEALPLRVERLTDPDGPELGWQLLKLENSFLAEIREEPLTGEKNFRLLRKMGLQAVICTPPDKLADIMPLADRTLLVSKDKYKMHILSYEKEMAEQWSET